jgi:hypothetical protein
MLRAQRRLPATLVVALAALLGLAGPALGDPIADWSSAPPQVVIAEPTRPPPEQLDFFATAGTWLTTEFDRRDFDVARWEASLPLAIVETAPPPRAPMMVAATKTDEPKPARQPTPRSARNKPAAAKSRVHAAKPPLQTRTPRDKADETPTISIPTGAGVIAAAPPVQPQTATLRAKSRAPAASGRPRILFIARVAPLDGDDVMPSHPVIPVTRVPLAPVTTAQVARAAARRQPGSGAAEAARLNAESMQ